MSYSYSYRIIENLLMKKILLLILMFSFSVAAYADKQNQQDIMDQENFEVTLKLNHLNNIVFLIKSRNQAIDSKQLDNLSSIDNLIIMNLAFVEIYDDYFNQPRKNMQYSKLDLRKILSFSSCLLKESNQKMPLSNRIGIDHLTQKEQEKLNQDFWAYIDLKCKEK